MRTKRLGGQAGYLCAVLAASCAFAVLVGAATSARRHASFLDDLRADDAALVLFGAGILFAALVFFVVVAGSIPSVIVHKVAACFSIQSIWYYVSGGALVGVVLSVLAAIMLHDFSFWLGVFILSSLAVPSGVVGGVTYWFLTGRFMSKDAVPFTEADSAS
jgi:hypothetical protein